MVRPSEGISIDDAFQQSIGEFGREQKRLYFIVSHLTCRARHSMSVYVRHCAVQSSYGFDYDANLRYDVC